MLENRQRGRVQKNIIAKNPYVSGAEPFKHSFTDSGLFGLKLSGSSANVAAFLIQGQDIVRSAIEELRALANITEEELNEAKNLLKVKFHSHLEDPSVRLEDAAKLLSLLKTPNVNFAEYLDKVTVSQVEDAVKKALKSRPTIYVSGGDASNIGSYDSLASKFA